MNSRWGEEFWGCSLPPPHCKEATGSLSQQAQSLPAWLLLRGQHRPLAHVTWMELAVDSQASVPARALPTLELHMGDRYCWSGIGLKVVQVWLPKVLFPSFLSFSLLSRAEGDGLGFIGGFS